MAPIKMTTPEGEVKILGPGDTSPHRFADMGGEIISPGDPPTRTEAAQKVMAIYFDGPGGDVDYPTREAVDAELERMQELYLQGAFERA